MKGSPRREVIFLYSVTKKYEGCYIFFVNSIENVNFLYGARLVGGIGDFLAKVSSETIFLSPSKEGEKRVFGERGWCLGNFNGHHLRSPRADGAHLSSVFIPPFLEDENVAGTPAGWWEI